MRELQDFDQNPLGISDEWIMPARDVRTDPWQLDGGPWDDSVISARSQDPQQPLPSGVEEVAL